MVFTREKNDTSNQKPQRCVSFALKFPPFIAACSAASLTFKKKSFTQRVFLAKKSEKHFGTVFVISGLNKVSVSVIGLGGRLGS